MATRLTKTSRDWGAHWWLPLALCVLVTWILGWHEVQAAATASSEPPSASQRARPLRILTWNVLASEIWEGWVAALGLVEPPAMRRAHDLLQAIQGLGADIVLLQEVTAPFLRVLGADPYWHGFHANVSAEEDPPGGLLILSRFPIIQSRYQRLPSPSIRYLLIAKVMIDGQDLTVANLHLESLPQERAARVRQLQAIAGNRGLDSGKRTIIAGDFNYGDADEESRLPHLSGWQDAWLKLRPQDPGLTYDVRHNPLARGNAFANEPSRRLDRILLSGDLLPLAVGLVKPGPNPGPGSSSGPGAGQPPSDHYGVWVDIQSG